MSEVLSIGEVARRFGLRASALRYYEDIGLVRPSARRAGQRHYGDAALRRLALVQLLRHRGRLSLRDIAGLLAGPSDDGRARRLIAERIEALNEHIRVAEEARACLQHLLSCPRADPFDGCPVLAAEVDRRLARAAAVPRGLALKPA
ncbi:MerR family transcriptional regulator [Phenylobacterium sp.]|uniref:MerR family transcriptional regulator n=1 Tax=Phenylobacterium sp. TaxID=1871053 RepID=UPI0025F6DDFD|nr:MerR family transcriptional regulator [Phenylobacterium sp.]MBX3485930.1 MerR family transcriptional regulator [Phenylobacterium sp.]